MRVSHACLQRACESLFGVMVRMRTKVMTCPPTRGLRLIPLPACTDPLQAGWTPLHYAARHDARATAEVLLEHKAEMDAQDNVGEAWWWSEESRCGLYVGHW